LSWAGTIREISVGEFFVDLYYRALAAPDDTWAWFYSLNREEWLVVLIITCSCGFLALLGFKSNRI
jgi:hypothetical protein